MPSTMTHAYMAHDIYKRLDNKIKLKLKDKLENYVTFSQGADILYFYGIILPIGNFYKVQKLGGKVHCEKVNELFISLTKKIKESKDFNQFVYLIGLITHYMGDTTCHPLINFKAWKMKKQSGKSKDYHYVVETYLDNYVINLKGHNYKKFKCHKFAFNAKKEESVVKLLNESFEEVFKQKNMGNIYYRAINHMRTFFKYLRYDPYRFKRYFYNILHLFTFYIKRDLRYLSYNFPLTEEENTFFLNSNNLEWFYFRNNKLRYNKTFLDLYEETIDKSIKMIETIYDYIYENKKLDLEKFYGNLSYIDGLPI